MSTLAKEVEFPKQLFKYCLACSVGTRTTLHENSFETNSSKEESAVLSEAMVAGIDVVEAVIEDAEDE